MELLLLHREISSIAIARDSGSRIFWGFADSMGSQGGRECAHSVSGSLSRTDLELIVQSRVPCFSEKSNDLILNPDMPSANVDQIFKRRVSACVCESDFPSFRGSFDVSVSTCRARFLNGSPAHVRPNVAINDQSVLRKGRSYARSQREVE